MVNEAYARHVGSIEERLGYQLRRVDLMAMGRLYDELAQIGLTPGRATALAFIRHTPGCDQMALGRALGVNRASTMTAVNALVALGAVVRNPGRDRRSNALNLTEAGERLLDQVDTITREQEVAFFGVLTADEQAELRRLLTKTRTANSAHAPRLEPVKRALLRRIK